MPSTTRLSLTLTGAFLLGAVGTAMHMASGQTAERAAAFAREGRVAEGRIKDGYQVHIGHVETYELTATFVDEAGNVRQCFSAAVPNTIFNRAVRAGKVQVTYLPSDPGVCYFDSDRPRPENNPVFDVIKYVAWGAALLAVGSLFISFGGEAPQQKPHHAPIRATSGPRNGFGRRRS